jgi:hypothetical protein
MCCTHRMMMGGSSGSRLSLSLSYKLLRTAQKRKKKRTFVRSFVPLHSHHRVYYAERGPWRAQEREEKNMIIYK